MSSWITESRLIILGNKSTGYGLNCQTGAEFTSQLLGASPWASPRASLAPSFPTHKVESCCIMRLCCLVAKSCPSLCDPMNYSLPGSSVLGISQAEILGWVTIFLLQGIFLIQGSNPCPLHCRKTLYH